MVKLFIEPNTPPLSWDEFVSIKPPFSIALDGYVNESARFDERGPHANFDHHANVDRLATHSTCGQVLLAIRQGLVESFPEMNIFVNDCDEDVCTAWFLLNNSFLVSSTINPLLNKLVHLEDVLDSTGGAYCLPKDLPVLRTLNWIYEPYRLLRASGEIQKKDEAQYRNVIENVEYRIMLFLNGKAKEKWLDTEYEILAKVKNVFFVKEVGVNARVAMFSDGIRTYVSMGASYDSKESKRVVIGKMSPYIKFDVYKLYRELNKIDGSFLDSWGGSNIIGGSPRVAGTKLTMQEIIDVIKGL
jgi:hypothetical protein